MDEGKEMDSDNLIQWLKSHGCHYKTALEKLKEEQYDSTSFIEMSDTELVELDPCLKKGPLTKLRALRNRLRRKYTKEITHKNCPTDVSQARDGINSGHIHSRDTVDVYITDSSESTGAIESGDHEFTARSNGSCDCTSVMEERPTMKQMCHMKYKEGGRDKYLRIKEEIAKYWKFIAPFLDITQARINIIEKDHGCDPVGATNDMLVYWRVTDSRYSWRKLLFAMREATDELNVVALTLERALFSILGCDSTVQS